MHTNDSHPTGAPAVPVAWFTADVAAALRGRRDRRADQRVWPYALAPVVLAAADAALNGPAVLAHDLTTLAAGVLDVVGQLGQLVAGR